MRHFRINEPGKKCTHHPYNDFANYPTFTGKDAIMMVSKGQWLLAYLMQRDLYDHPVHATYNIALG